MQQRNAQQYAVRNQEFFCLEEEWGWVVTGRGHKGDLWDAGDVIFLIMDAGCVGVIILQNLSIWATVICVHFYVLYKLPKDLKTRI